ncbi:hypothetical protein [Streptomyces hydrogenans]|uniref:hypothetical protein n=1 Tax=Streptomyces hydrogenans TaxID=1873719 RepID=UPI0035DBDD5B
MKFDDYVTRISEERRAPANLSPDMLRVLDEHHAEYIRLMTELPAAGEHDKPDHFLYVVSGERQCKFGFSNDPKTRLRNHELDGMPVVHRVYRGLTKPQAKELEDQSAYMLSVHMAGHASVSGKEYYVPDAVPDIVEFLDSHPFGLDDVTARPDQWARMAAKVPRKKGSERRPKDVVYLITSQTELKIGVTSGSPKNRLGAHRRTGHTEVVRLFTHLPAGRPLATERAVKAALHASSFQCTSRGDEYWPVEALPIALGSLDAELAGWPDRAAEWKASLWTHYSGVRSDWDASQYPEGLMSEEAAEHYAELHRQDLERMCAMTEMMGGYIDHFRRDA